MTFNASSPPHLRAPRARSFDEAEAAPSGRAARGRAYSHGGGYHDAGLPTIDQASPLSCPVAPGAFKPGPYSPTFSAAGDSLRTDRTSPMSSPSLSPHASPFTLSRGRPPGGDRGPPVWRLSEPTPPDHRPGPPHPRRRHPADRPAPPAPGAGPRAATEVLKTLLRKKACLYEPGTSPAVALAAWLVGRRLALARGYFARPELQAGVHAVVAAKIAAGRVTRTKVNRCLQVVLNSCFHYVIPRPDGTEEQGTAEQRAFAAEAADEEALLGSLPPPWDGLVLPLAGTEGPTAAEASARDDGDGSSGGRRAVLLCFNENIRCAADVGRCHDEFIRDVARAGGLGLGPEDWRAFFAGARGLPARSLDRCLPVGPDGILDRRDLARFRTSWCAKRYDHDHAACSFAHVEVNRGWLRRDPDVVPYAPVPCPHVRPLLGAPGCYVNACPRGEACDKAHSAEEILYHPERRPGHAATACSFLRDLGVAATTAASARPSGRPEHVPPRRAPPGRPRSTPGTPPRRARLTAGGAPATGFGVPPGGAPTLYVAPAPPSAFERTLALPGLRALFRDHAAALAARETSDVDDGAYGAFGRETRRR